MHKEYNTMFNFYEGKQSNKTVIIEGIYKLKFFLKYSVYFIQKNMIIKIHRSPLSKEGKVKETEFDLCLGR